MKYHTTLFPVLFNIQINNIKSLILNNHLICYADDTVLICIGDTWNEEFKNIETNLKTINTYLGTNSLCLNFEKSTIILHSV